MKEFRKQWSWPTGLADKMYYIIRKWDNQYERTGRIYKSRRVPHERYGEEMPETEIIMRIHTLAFTYPELKWLNSILQTEDENTTQARIFAEAQKVFEQKQEKGMAPPGFSLSFDLALTRDEVAYLRMLLECIGKYRKPTPSEREGQAKQAKEGVTDGEW